MPDTQPKTDVIIVAAGESRRMKGIDKLTMPLDGEPVLLHSLNIFQNSELVNHVAIVTKPSSKTDAVQNMLQSQSYAKDTTIVSGGRRRQDSVKSGIDALIKKGSDTSFITVHDAARPFINEDILHRGLITANKVGAAIPVLPMKDTVKQIRNGLVISTPNRAELYSVQTPQIFKREVLTAAHSAIKEDVTDDASMVERAGGLVAAFEGESDNIKITTPADILIAEAIARSRSNTSTQPMKYRYGIGFDAHRLVPEGPLVLGGVNIEFDMHLEGHSDGDVLMHSVASAVLGAARLGDMGVNFPSSDARYADVESSLFVKTAVQMAHETGWEVDFVDATVIAQCPRLSGFRTEFESHIAKALGVDESKVNVKITSTDRIGIIGAGEGIAAEAIATLKLRNNQD